MKMIFNYDAIKTYFRYKSLARSLVLRVRFFGTRKWPIVVTTFGRMATLNESSSPALRKEQRSATSEKFKVSGKNYSRVLLFLLFVTFKKFWVIFCMNQFDGFHRVISISQSRERVFYLISKHWVFSSDLFFFCRVKEKERVKEKAKHLVKLKIIVPKKTRAVKIVKQSVSFDVWMFLQDVVVCFVVAVVF